MISCKHVLYFVVAAMLQSTVSFADQNNTSSSDSYGYALLYGVVSQNKNVDKLLWIKNPGKPVETWVNDIASLSAKVNDQLETWHEDGTIQNLKDMGLPPTEVEARARATSRTRGDLLLSNGIDLRVDLIVAQLKALGYCADLSYAMAKETSNSAIQKQLNSWQSEFTKLNAKGMSLLKTDIPQE
ncbi:hypothetical protein [Rubellicoccus peritrichatus]|uniref:DUF1318 domain-containing protein n=1 Tax=Rubellicoccus peritrichatus TaxID=3080537 RepID=A0AAQ3LEB5_9BACT|nr:hypothetical protein [Puniceicoccus sp. CR14]WOO43102.1 hypothetical protein RZN69_08350 [Puniceicoccus sp. CR14]